VRRLLVTGSAGYLGGEVVRRARRAGIDVVVGTWHRRPVDGGNDVWVDIRDRRALAQVFQAVRPDAVIHTAFAFGGAETWATTVEGAGNVAANAASSGARLVHVSSDGERDGRYREEDPVGPVTAYAEAKAAAEGLVVEAHPAAVIARSALIVGGQPGNSQERLVVDALDATSETTFFTDELRTPVEVGDLATALLELAGGDFTGCIHLGGRDVVSRAELAGLIAASLGRSSAELRTGPAPPGRSPRNAALDSSLAAAILSTRLRGVRAVFRS
jgi:dTDP-4-dehydrorhamnose reductase